MLRVLIADDSETSRRLLVQILSREPGIQVIGEAKDGLEAVRLTQELRPHLVAMDSRMPRMDGFEATKEIMITCPTPIVIVTSSDENGDLQATMRSLWAGALTVAPTLAGLNSAAFEEAARQLIGTVKAMAQVKVVRHHRTATHLERPTQEVTAQSSSRGRVIAIATSTGGPPALQRLLSGLPEEFPAPILVVQHISRGFTVGFAAWLNTVCRFHVKVAEGGDPLVPRTVYLAPEDRHLGTSDRLTLMLSNEPPIGGFRPSGTFLFKSVAKVFGQSAVGLILTGMGQDGVEGLRAIREAGGQIIAQDEDTSVVFGMPGAAVAAGLPDVVLPIEAIAGRLAEII